MSNIQFSNLETERLIIRRFRESDAEPFFAYRTRPEVYTYQGERWVDFTHEQAAQFVRDQLDSGFGVPDTWVQLAVELKEAGQLIGDLGIHSLPHDTRQAEIGFTIHPDFQKKGYGIEAVLRLIEYLFTSLQLHRVIAITDVRNKASICLIEKTGMRREGLFLKNTWNKGEYTDEYLYALLREEWSHYE